MIINVKIRELIISDNPLKAVVSVTIDKAIAIHDIKIIENKDGKVFLTFPSKKDKKGTYKNIIHPINQEARKLIESIVLENYKKAYDSYVIKHADC